MQGQWVLTRLAKAAAEVMSCQTNAVTDAENKCIDSSQKYRFCLTGLVQPIPSSHTDFTEADVDARRGTEMRSRPPFTCRGGMRKHNRSAVDFGKHADAGS